MTTTYITHEPLALLGGSPAAPDLAMPAWPPLLPETEENLLEVYRSRQWSFNGPQEQAFASEFAAYHGAKYGVFMANGTVTLQCALQALGLGEGDEVILPALTWPATAMAILYVGATPVFVDIDADSLCLDHSLVESAITPRTKAIIPVHLYGGMADLEVILEIADRHSLFVIEDCAHGHGGIWNGRGLGSWGAIGSFSFQQSKTMASGEGGICLTNDAGLAERLYRLKHIGYERNVPQGQAASGPDADLVCHNFRGTDFQAALLRDQLRGLKTLLETYAANAARLEERLASVPGVRLQARGRLADAQSYYALGVIIDESRMRVPLARITEALAAEGANIGGTYGPVYRHLLWNVAADKYRLPQGGCPVAEGPGTRNTLAIPHPWLGAEPEVIESLADVLVKVLSNIDALA